METKKQEEERSGRIVDDIHDVEFGSMCRARARASDGCCVLFLIPVCSCDGFLHVSLMVDQLSRML